MRLADFIEETNNAASPDAVFEIFLRAVGQLGFDRVMYSALANSPYHDTRTSPAILRNYPDDWIAHYVEQGYVLTDPVRRQCVVARRPFAWSEIERSPRFDAKHLRIFPEAASAGLHDGVAVPFHGPGGETMGVGLASSLGGVQPLRLLNKINVIATQFHIAYTALADPGAPDAELVISEREREILQWCLVGKSNSMIGDILGLTDKAIEYHLSKIFTKLGVASRVPAVAKAVNLGIISF